MKTNVDYNFNVGLDVINPAFEGELNDITETPAIVVKSDEVRIIARKDDDRGGINGSIRLIKEGDINGDQASIYLLPDGIVQISGSKIYIGQSGQGHGPSTASSEPYVRYSDLQTLLTTYWEDVISFCEQVSGHQTPGYGAPSVQINNAVSFLKAKAQVAIDNIPTIMSDRIFGE